MSDDPHEVDDLGLEQMERYANDLTTLYVSEKNSRKELASAIGQMLS